jgi:predicted amidohydrolase
VLLLFPVLACAANLVENPTFREATPGQPTGWTTWSPRPQIAPKFQVAKSAAGPLLTIKAKDFADYGKWMTTVEPIEGGHFYRFEVEYRPRGVQFEEVSIAAMLSWRASGASNPIQRDYVDRRTAEGEWKRLVRTLQAPPKASGVDVELIFRWSAGGEVEWRAPTLVAVDAPKPRRVRIATTQFRPHGPTTIESNLREMTAMIDSAGREKADIVCLSENLAERGIDAPLEARAHPIPGPITEALGASARRNNLWVVTALVERDGDIIYNTAVLIDRKGKVAGKYRKVHLPMSEAEDGMTPGSEYQVFDTDFGRVGLVVCWDNWFVETARILRLKGAEILLFPLAGDGDAHWDLMSRARAVDNGLYIVSSNTVGGNSRIVDPSGAVLAEATVNSRMAIADLDLNREWRTKWLSIGPGYGEAKSLYIQERRPDTYSDVSGQK